MLAFFFFICFQSVFPQTCSVKISNFLKITSQVGSSEKSTGWSERNRDYPRFPRSAASRLLRRKHFHRLCPCLSVSLPLSLSLWNASALCPLRAHSSTGWRHCFSWNRPPSSDMHMHPMNKMHTDVSCWPHCDSIRLFSQFQHVRELMSPTGADQTMNRRRSGQEWHRLFSHSITRWLDSIRFCQNTYNRVTHALIISVSYYSFKHHTGWACDKTL